MSAPKTAGRYLAEDRGAFDRKPQPNPQPEMTNRTHAATAPLRETAIAHMPSERLIAFWRWFGDLD